MNQTTPQERLFASESIWKLLIRIAPPVMLAQLIQALYNIIDSYFVGQFSGDGLTALSVIFPIQLVITAFSVGTGVGVNILMARLFAQNRYEEANGIAGAGGMLALITWAVFSALSVLLLPAYVRTSVTSPAAIEHAVTYGNIVCIGSLGIFLESVWTKVHQAGGNMRLPMFAQIVGALLNIVLDPLLIFGWGPFPALGIAGAGIATVIGQFAAAVLVGLHGMRRPPKPAAFVRFAAQIYQMGYAYILMQALCTVYIIVLNVILAGFSDGAVTVLGLYYKFQSFFFIPLLGLETCIVPVLSYNYARRDFARCKKILTSSILIALVFMLAGVLCFEFLPAQLISLFSGDSTVLEIGIPAFRIIGASFFPAVFSLMTPVFFQAIGATLPSVLLSLTRQIFCLIPIFWLLSLIGLPFTWIAFPASECIAGGLGIVLCVRQIRRWEQPVPAE